MKIKYIAALAALILLTGCNQSVKEKDLSKIMSMCKVNEGINHVRFYGTYYKVYCNNGYTADYITYGK